MVYYSISLISSSDVDKTSNLYPFLHKFSMILVLEKQAPGVKTPAFGNFPFSFNIVAADKSTATQVAPYPIK